MTEPWFRQAFAAHYPVLYGHRDENEARRCLELLPTLAPWEGIATGAPARVLDLGCGDGRHLQSLAAAGVPALGLDLSPDLLAVARERLAGSGALPLMRGDMRRLPVRDAAFTAVASLFTAFGYFGALAANRPVVAEVARALRTGGHWFLDYLDCRKVRDELAAHGPVAREREVGPLAVHELRALTPEADRVVKEVRIQPAAGRQTEAAALDVPPQGLAYREEVALFELAAMDELAAEHDLERVAAAGSYDGCALGQGDRWILVYRKQSTS